MAMAKLKVIEAFNDGVTGESHNVGDIIEREDERARVMLAAGVVEAVEKPKAEKSKHERKPVAKARAKAKADE